jgi:hypothetical protein
MKRTACKLLVLLMVMGTLGAVEAKAQIEMHLKMSSPFIAGETMFPAGSYTIIQQEGEPELLEISSADHAHSALLTSEIITSETPRAKSEIIFNRYGNSLVMKQLWVAGSSDGFLVFTGRAEKRAARAGKPTKQSVEVTSK